MGDDESDEADDARDGDARGRREDADAGQCEPNPLDAHPERLGRLLAEQQHVELTGGGQRQPDRNHRPREDHPDLRPVGTGE